MINFEFTIKKFDSINYCWDKRLCVSTWPPKLNFYSYQKILVKRDNTTVIHHSKLQFFFFLLFIYVSIYVIVWDTHMRSVCVCLCVCFFIRTTCMIVFCNKTKKLVHLCTYCINLCMYILTKSVFSFRKIQQIPLSKFWSGVFSWVLTVL